MNEQTKRMLELMRKESNRLKTFQLYPPWPKDYVDIKKLARAGFFYAFEADKVYCAFCRGQVHKWERNDDPMTEHARHFNTCPFIMGGEVGNEPLGEDPFPGPKRPRPYDVCGIFSNLPPNREETQQEITGGSLNEADVHHYNPSDNEQSESELEHELGNTSEPDLELINQFQVHHHSPLLNESSSDSLSTLSNNSNSSSSSSSNLNGICKICYTNSIQLVFLPCGHSVSCLSCSQRLHSCPCCRSKITTRIRTFLV